MREERLAGLPKDSTLVDQQLKEQLTGIFSKLEKDLTIVTIVDDTNSQCLQMCGFLEVVTGLSPRLSLEILFLGENPQMEACLHAEQLPVAGLFSQGQYLGVNFHGVPGGKEINAFVLALYNAGGPGQPLDAALEKQICSLKKKRNVKIFVSLSCHHCSSVVTACQRIALLNPNIEAEMIDARLYPDLVETYQISSVPVILVDNQAQYLGEKTLDQIVGFLR